MLERRHDLAAKAVDSNAEAKFIDDDRRVHESAHGFCNIWKKSRSISIRTNIVR
jgi:hypothetical protein